MEPTWTSWVPPLLAVVLAFATRDAIISLLVACVVGVVRLGEGVQGFPATVAARLIAGGQVAEVGVRFPEHVFVGTLGDELLSGLAERNGTVGHVVSSGTESPS